ncbi:YlcI/YnfO family protein, partial [Escherichia coli]|uniref:YlcI/YnfO family protein n=1 Tax=Escherichia coli TaxID=562 RepID=UPI000B3EE8C0
MSTKNRTRRTTTRNIRFPNQMIEQINIALGHKGSGNFSAWAIDACRRRLTSERRAYTLLNSDEERTPRVLPSEQDALY